MTNAVGEGPAAMTRVRTTDAPDVPHEEPKTKLILCAEYSILSQGTELWSDSAQGIYSSAERITGVAIHIAEKLIFVADEARYVYKYVDILLLKNSALNCSYIFIVSHCDCFNQPQCIVFSQSSTRQ